jgi:hypothetical protein
MSAVFVTVSVSIPRMIVEYGTQKENNDAVKRKYSG